MRFQPPGHGLAPSDIGRPADLVGPLSSSRCGCREERPSNTDLQRALLEAQAEIAIAAGDLDRARSAADELERVAGRFESKALVASAALARGRVQLADGDAAAAEQSLSDAVRFWNEVGAPYEAAMARISPAIAHRVSGSEHRAVREEQSVRTILDGIKAAPTVTRSWASRRTRHSTSGRPPAPTRSDARATTGPCTSTGKPCTCAISRACSISRGFSPTPASLTLSVAKFNGGAVAALKVGPAPTTMTWPR